MQTNSNLYEKQSIELKENITKNRQFNSLLLQALHNVIYEFLMCFWVDSIKESNKMQDFRN